MTLYNTRSTTAGVRTPARVVAHGHAAEHKLSKHVKHSSKASSKGLLNAPKMVNAAVIRRIQSTHGNVGLEERFASVANQPEPFPLSTGQKQPRQQAAADSDHRTLSSSRTSKARSSSTTLKRTGLSSSRGNHTPASRQSTGMHSSPASFFDHNALKHLLNSFDSVSTISYIWRIICGTAAAGTAVALFAAVTPLIERVLARCPSVLHLQTAMMKFVTLVLTMIRARSVTHPRATALVAATGVSAYLTYPRLPLPVVGTDSEIDGDGVEESSAVGAVHSDLVESECSSVAEEEEHSEIDDDQSDVPAYDMQVSSDLDAFWAEAPDKHQRLPLHTEEIKQHKYDFEADGFSHWHAELTTFLEMRHPQAAYLLRAPCDDAAEIIEQYANAANANTWLAAPLRALCDKSKKRANLFVQELMEAESVEPQISTSGIDVAERIRLAVTERDRVDQEQEWETLQSTVYLNAGMSEIDVRLAIKKIASKMRVVPVHRKEAPHALMRTIVAKMPSQPPALADEKKKYLAVLDRAEKLREPPTLESQPLDVKRLTEWIVVDIAQHSTPAQRAESEVSSAERRKQRNERFKNHKGPCTTCAGDHHWTQCSAAPCGKCNRRWCQGAWNMQCFGELDDPPIYKNKLGEALPKNLQHNMNEYRKSKGKAVKEVSVLEYEPVEPVPEDNFGFAHPSSLDASVHVSTIELVPSTDSETPECAAAASLSQQTCLVQSDSGANIMLFKTGSVLADRAFISASSGTDTINLASTMAMPTCGSASLPLFVNGTPVATLIGHVADSARRDVLGTTPLWSQAGIAVLTHPFNVVIDVRSSRTEPLVSQNGLSFIRFKPLEHGVDLLLTQHLTMDVDSLMAFLTAKNPSTPDIVVAGVEHRVQHRALLWAARLGADSDGLKKLLKATRGIDLTTISSDTARFIDSDTIHRGTTMRRAPVSRVDPVDATTSPGTNWQLDGYGHMTAQSLIDGTTYQWVVIDAVSDLGYSENSKSSSQASCIAFLDKWHKAELALGHKPVELRIDAVPNLNADGFRTTCASRYEVHVPPAAGGDHENIAKTEAAQDPLTRKAEASLRRAEKNRSYFLPARGYALTVRNFRVKRGETKSRIHIHTGRPSDFSGHPPLLFGCRVNLLIEKSKRDGMGAQRYEEGEVVGMTAAGKYSIWKPATRTTVLRRDAEPIGELAMALRGVPSSAGSADIETQTDDADFPPLTIPAPLAPSAPSLKVTAGYDPLPDGTRLEVGFKGADGSTVFYAGVVKASHPQTGGKVFTEFTWDDPASANDPAWKGRLFDLTSQHHPWRLPTPPPAPADRPAGGDAARKPTRRQSVRLASMTGASATVSALIDAHSSNQHVELLNQAVYQHYGDSLSVSCASLLDLDQARVALLAAEAFLIELGSSVSEVSVVELGLSCDTVVPGSAAMLEVSKASVSNDVLVKTKSGGSYTIHVPRNQKDHERSPEKAEWAVSHRNAHLAIVNDPRNSMVKISHVKGVLQAIIAPCVMEDKVKLDSATGELDKFKSRICYDEARATRVKMKLGIEEHHLLYANDTDDITFKAFMADAVIDADDVTAADLKDAYWHADRFHTAYCWMHTYEPMYDEDGDQLCYQCGAPMNGEKTAGSDYHIWRDGVFESAGAKQSITCLGTFYIADADGNRLTICTCTDDFIMKETAGNGKTLTIAVLGTFAKAMGGWDKVKFVDRPTSYKGYGIAWSRDNRVVSLHMTSHIESLAHRYVPKCLRGEIPPDTLSGLQLCRAADELRMISPRPLVLGKIAKEVQAMGGGIKYVERATMPRVSRIMHKVSCCSASPPDEARIVARSVIVIMFKHRYECITYGGAQLGTRVLLQGGLYCPLVLADGAPLQLESMADATTGEAPVYALAVSYNGGVIAHAVKKIEGVVPNSCLAECRGSTRASEAIEIAREALIVFGRPPTGPSIIGTDNSANLAITLGTATPARAKPDLIKWASLKDRIRRQVATMTKVDTAVMPVDFMTKWLKSSKMEEQLAYLINSRHAVWPA